MLFAYAMIKNIVILIICQVEELFNDPFLAFLLPIFDSYLICLIASLLNRFRISWIIAVLYTIIVTGEVFVIYIYHSLFSINVLQLIVETNSQEATEFMLSALAKSAPWIAMSLALVCWLLAWYTVKVLGQRLSGHVKVVTGLSIGLIVLVVWSGVRQMSAYSKLYQCFVAEDSSQLGAPERRPHLNTPIVRLLHSVAFNMVQSRELPQLVESISNTQVDGCSNESPLIVMIIGESYNKHHTPLYNPESLPTTPHMCQMLQDSTLVVYNDVVSPSNMTSVVLMQMFSTWDTTSPNGWSSHTVFPAIFRKAGYEVAYLSNQFVLDNKTADTWSSMGGAIFNNRQLSEMQFSWRNDMLAEYDGNLLSQLPDSIVHSDKPRLVMIHLMGQHVGYEYRYPAGFGHFTIADVPESLGGNEGRETEAHYANATLYNDSVVSDIWKLFSEQDAVGIYLSDHGEEVYDWRNFHERSNGTHINREVARYQFEVPMMFMLSDKYQQLHPEMVAQIRQSANKPYITSNLPHLLFHLAGISTPDYMPERDILSDRYDATRHRIIGEDTDYDLLITE